MTAAVPTETRHATLEEMAELLKAQKGEQLDLVVPASKIRSREGIIYVQADPDSTAEIGFKPNEVFDEGLSAKLDIPRKYLARCRDKRIDLYDANVNGWLRGRKALTRQAAFSEPGQEPTTIRVIREGIPGDPRSFLIRAFK